MKNTTVLVCGTGLWLLAVLSMQVSVSNAATFEVGPGQAYVSIQACLNAVSPGDTCNVHAGTYIEQLSLPVSGTSASRITLKSNGNDAVTVQSTLSPVLKINGKSYWTLSGINYTYNGGGSNPSVIRNNYGDNVDGITIQGGTITVSSGSGAGYGIYVASGNNTIVSGVTVAITATSGAYDGMEFLYAANLTITRCTIYGVGNASGTLEDGIVTNGTNITITDNILHDGWSQTHADGIVIQGAGDRTGSGGGTTHNVNVSRNTVYNFSQGIYLDAIFTAIDGTNLIANNVIYEGPTFQVGAIVDAMNCILIHGENLSNNPGYPIVVNIYNNTLDCRQLQMFTDDLVNGSAIDIQNNIFINSSFAGQHILFTNGVSMDHNYYSQGSGTPIRWGGATYSLTSFQSNVGQERNAVSGAVGLNLDYTENSESDSRNRGVNFSAVFTNDRAGVSRSASPASWDMGAYTYSSGLLPPPAPTDLRVQ